VQFQVLQAENFPKRTYPLLFYPGVITEAPAGEDLCSRMQSIFEQNNWKNGWTDSIYEFHHYHSNTHEVLGIFRGSASVQFGGDSGLTLSVLKGDVIIIPAGLSHCRLGSSRDFKCCGAYPGGAQWDMNYGKESAAQLVQVHKNIHHVQLPELDPLFGQNGPLFHHWNSTI